MDTYTDTLAPRFAQLLARREAELSALLAASDTVEERVQAQQHDVVDFKDVAAGETLATVEQAQAEHAAHELEQVLAARHRLDDHSFGQCRDCGEPIDLRRLLAMPATPFCTACQAIHERSP